MTVIECLSTHGIFYEQREQENLYIECPDCGKLNLSVSMSSGVWHCWNSDCEERGSRGSFPSLLQKLKINPDGVQIETTPIIKKDKTLTQDDIDTILHAASNRPQVIEWSVSRGLDPTFVLSQGVGYDTQKRAIVFPFRNPSGQLIGAKYRGDNGDQWTKGYEPDLYILDPTDLAQEKIVIVEGEVDALTLKMFQIPVAAVLGASKDKGFYLLSAHRQVYLGYDMDQAGNAGAEKAATTIGRYRCKRISWRAKDPNDMLKAGSTKEEIIECIKSASSLATDIKSKSAKAALQDYLTGLDKAPRRRLSWGYPGLDSFTNGLGGGEFIGILAEAGTGKTTFIINVTRNLAHAGVNAGIASIEEHPTYEVTPKLVATMVGRNPGAGGFSPEEIESVEKEINRVQLYDGDNSVESVIDWIRECYFVHDVRVVFVDYLQLLIRDETNVQLVKETCYAFKSLTKELPELAIVMVIQPKQKQRVIDFKSGDEFKAPKLDGCDARGGAAINQSVDKMLTMKSVDGHPNLVQLEYTKVRGHLHVSKSAWSNRFAQLYYDHATLRQAETVQLTYGGN